jgi:hypothetical protein
LGWENIGLEGWIREPEVEVRKLGSKIQKVGKLGLEGWEV